MGQKVNPIGLRLNITRSWESVWYADKGYAVNLNEDQRVRAYLKKRLYHAGISQIMVERTGDKVKIKLFAARPGVIIGKKGAEIENLKKGLDQEFKRPFLDRKSRSKGARLSQEAAVSCRHLPDHG